MFQTLLECFCFLLYEHLFFIVFFFVVTWIIQVPHRLLRVFTHWMGSCVYVQVVPLLFFEETKAKAVRNYEILYSLLCGMYFPLDLLT